MILDKIRQPNDIKKLTAEEIKELSGEIRQFLLETISETGGHLASNLGVVELTMALHLCLDLPRDKIVWDVGHQSYTHKLLTGRRKDFVTLRQHGGMSGFPKSCESDCDCFNTGHSSTSISAALGLAQARDLKGEDYTVVAVIGDGALTGGMAYEALNNASNIKKNFIIILNDNKMSISPNVGGMSRLLNRIRTDEKYIGLKNGVINSLKVLPRGDEVVEKIRNTKSSIKQLFIPGMFFEEMDIMYLGPVDGSRVDRLMTAIEEAKRVEGPVLIHVLTRKGKGYRPAEKHPARFHGAEPFDLITGKPKNPKTKAAWTDVFGRALVAEAKKNDRVLAITAAMSSGTGLTSFAKNFPDRFFDVGIAEAHGVTFSAGLAKGGMIPVFAVYSSFLQRGYDQILHDVCIQNLHVVFAVDRAGIVGADGETHQGIFDLSYLSCMPNMTIMAPKNRWELSDMLIFAIEKMEGPAAIRYPRGEAFSGLKEFAAPLEFHKAEALYMEKDIALFALGSMVETASLVRERIKAEQPEIGVSLINARFADPFDEEMVAALTEDHKLLVTLEENVLSGGMGQKIAAHIAGERLPIEVLPIALPNAYVEHGSVKLLKEELGLDTESIYRRVMERYEGLVCQNLQR